jgi:sugar O-acyltransferase (sialic acid O-acetyltransferase NeuD family)
MADLICLGGGGHARVVLDAVLDNGENVIAVLDPCLEKGSLVHGVPVRGGDDHLAPVSPSQVGLLNGLGANPDTGRRRAVFEQWTARGFVFVAVRHRSAVVARDCSIGEGAQVMAGAVLQAGVRVGCNVVVNTRSSIDHDCIIHDHVFIAPGVTVCGGVVIGEASFVGAGAVLAPGVHVGAGSVVGAGAVVLRPVADGVVVVGNPAHPIQGQHR